MPAERHSRPARWLHWAAALAVFVLLVVLHAAAALHHALIRRDGTLSRMGLGRLPRKDTGP